MNSEKAVCVLTPVTTAVILAAGQGLRLAAVAKDVPKGLLVVGGEALVERSICHLFAAGITRAIIVTGPSHDHFSSWFSDEPRVELIRNLEALTASTFVSMCVGLREIDGPALLLEGDLVYDPAFLRTLLNTPAPDAFLISTPTRATDEVWVQLDGRGSLKAMSKDRTQTHAPAGELVGICKLSHAAREWLLACEQQLTPQARASACYETEGLVWLSREHPVQALLVDGARWGEIDDVFHLDRIQREVLPRLNNEESTRAAQAPTVLESSIA